MTVKYLKNNDFQRLSSVVLRIGCARAFNPLCEVSAVSNGKS
jgi:hypothetical protein